MQFIPHSNPIVNYRLQLWCLYTSLSVVFFLQNTKNDVGHCIRTIKRLNQFTMGIMIPSIQVLKKYHSCLKGRLQIWVQTRMGQMWSLAHLNGMSLHYKVLLTFNISIFIQCTISILFLLTKQLVWSHGFTPCEVFHDFNHPLPTFNGASISRDMVLLASTTVLKLRAMSYALIYKQKWK